MQLKVKKTKKKLFDFLNDLQKNDINPMTREKEVWDIYGEKCAIWVLDTSGFTKTSIELGTLHFLFCLIQMRKVVVPIIERFGSFYKSVESDSIIAIFKDPQSALDAAYEANSSMQKSKLMIAPDNPYKICIGIGYGDLLKSETDEGYYGLEMNLASKLGEDLANGDEILLTQAAFDNISKKNKTYFKKKKAFVSNVPFVYYMANAQTIL